ncbi:MAG: hypothetical protein WCP29_18245 [Acidobacteriota bacterium]
MDAQLAVLARSCGVDDEDAFGLGVVLVRERSVLAPSECLDVKWLFQSFEALTRGFRGCGIRVWFGLLRFRNLGGECGSQRSSGPAFGGSTQRPVLLHSFADSAALRGRQL